MTTTDTTTKAAHTPTPWANDGVHIFAPMDGVAALDIAVMMNDGKSHSENKANAAHIVRCVNAHDELKAALKALVIEGECVRCGKAPGADFAGSLATARQALAKAEGRGE